MLLKMIRSQNTDLGQLRMGVAYGFDMTKPAQAKVAKSLLDRKMAEKTTPAKVAAEAADAVARERAGFAETAETRGPATALGDLDRAAAEQAAAEKAEAEKDAAKPKGKGKAAATPPADPAPADTPAADPADDIPAGA